MTTSRRQQRAKKEVVSAMRVAALCAVLFSLGVVTFRDNDSPRGVLSFWDLDSNSRDGLGSTTRIGRSRLGGVSRSGSQNVRSNDKGSDRTLVNRERPDGSNTQHIEVGIVEAKAPEAPVDAVNENGEDVQSPHLSPEGVDEEPSDISNGGGGHNDNDDEAVIKALAQRLQPKTLKYVPISSVPSSPDQFPKPRADKTVSLSPHQFLHLHHMKTGGTSVDTHLNCAMKRMENLGSKNLTVPYTSLHECSATRYAKCLSGDDTRCRDRVSNVAMMSFCAPLYDLTTFGWTGEDDGDNANDENDVSSAAEQVEYSHHSQFHSLTVLRHPVSRAWSMYRFKPYNCYNCRSLIDVYKDIDDGNTQDLTPMCIQQLNNHMTANLLSTSSSRSIYDPEDDRTEDEMVEEAIHNLKTFFTMIGLTEQIQTTFDIMGYTFPWLNETIVGSERKCSLPHSNASPASNKCTRDDPNLSYDKEPDDETRKVIEAHNSMDIRVYDAAVELFEQQKRAIQYAKQNSD